jgi:pimeloyl-ACP methyl ester carboxylesterase
MKIEEYGKGNSKTIVMLHGAYFVHTFGRQYSLSKKYHIVIPHIMGFGDNTDKIFTTDECVRELTDYIKSINKKVVLVGFSLGGQLAFRLVSEYEELFESAIIVSPWLIKNESELAKADIMNKKQLKQLQNKFMCRIIGTMNGLPPKACKEFIAQMQNVKEETVHNIVYNGITIDSVPKFADISTPVIALAGSKEPKDIINSVKKMAETNKNCRFEIWDKASHNIPPVFSKKFNELICSLA